MNERKLFNLGKKKFAVVYYSGQSVFVYGESLEEVQARENALLESWKKRNPNIGIADIWEVAN